MKKLLSGLLAAAVALSLSVPAFAADANSLPETYKASDGSTIVITAGTNSGGDPNEGLGDYDFNVDGKVYKDVGFNGGMPVFSEAYTDADGNVYRKAAMSTDKSVTFPDQQFVYGYMDNGEVAVGVIGSENSSKARTERPVLFRDNSDNLYWVTFQSEDSSNEYYKIIKKYMKVSNGTANAPGSSVTFKCDTGAKLSIKAGKTYQFKITSNKRPTLTCGNGSIFKLISSSSSGSNYYFKFKAVGKAGQSAGFYINGSRCTVGTVS
jgi:hypothetical protein